eukprot:COSAG06_NODE_640_length_13515_cov_6.190206_6_plen_138_part_00
MSQLQSSVMAKVVALMEHEHAPTAFQFFRELDADRSGTITAHELAAAFAEHGLELTADETSSLMVDLEGADGDGEIELVEFMDTIQRARQLQRQPSHQRTHRRRHRQPRRWPCLGWTCPQWSGRLRLALLQTRWNEC